MPRQPPTNTLFPYTTLFRSLTLNADDFLDGRTLTNTGSATLSAPDYLYMTSGATFNNQAGATFTVSSAAGLISKEQTSKFKTEKNHVQRVQFEKKDTMSFL